MVIGLLMLTDSEKGKMSLWFLLDELEKQQQEQRLLLRELADYMTKTNKELFQ